MKKLFLAVIVAMLFMFCGKVLADCTASLDQVKPAQVVKAEAVKAREAGDLQLAAAKYQEAATLHPMEVYKAIYLLNAEGCLVGKWHPVKGYLIDLKKAEANKAAAQAILDQVKTLLEKVAADGCEYDNGVIKRATNWLGNAQDAINGVFH